jgi:hypothetical protein
MPAGPKKFGRISPLILPHQDSKVLQLGNYFKLDLRPAPGGCDWSKNQTYGMCLNNALGSCAIAASDHIIQCQSANTRLAPIVVPDATTLDVYKAISGYNGTPETDNGCILSDVFAYWKKTGIYGDNTIGSAAIDPSQINFIKWGMYIFGGVIFGFNLPQSAVDQSNNDQPWTVVHGSPIAGGHAVSVYRYNSSYLTGTSWGAYQEMDWQFIATYAEEVWICVNPIWLDATGVSPVGLNQASLITDMTLMAA